MLDILYQDMSLDKLVEVLWTAEKCGSGSVQDLKDLIIAKYNTAPAWFKATVQRTGGGMTGELVIKVRDLLKEYNLYDPQESE